MGYEINIYRKYKDYSTEELFYMSTKDKDKIISIICNIAQVLGEKAIEEDE